MKHTIATIRNTYVRKGLRSYFWFIYFLNIARSGFGRIIPPSKKFFNKVIYALPHKNFTIQNNLGSFFVHSHDDTISKSGPYFEYYYRSWFEIPDGKTFLDIGANIGFYSLYLANHQNPKKVYSFEPNPDIYNILSRNIALNDCESLIQTFNVGLGEKDGKFSFLRNKFHAGGSHLANDCDTSKKSEYTEVIDVDIKNFDNFSKAHKINPKEVGFIKIDVEGFELDTLKGMDNFLENIQAGTKMFIEIWNNNVYRKKTLKYLDNHGFSQLKHNKANYLFVKK